MNTLTKILTDKTSAAFEACGYSAELGAVTVSDRPDLCQFQCNGAFAGAKLYHKAPRMIASDVAAKLADDPDIAKAESVGAGFLNIDLADGFILKYVSDMLADPALGIPQTEKPETVVLDYGGPNVAKPLHIGHLRAAVIGEALKRLVRSTGRTAIGDVHLGDWGLQIGLVIAELKERHPEWEIWQEGYDLSDFGGIGITAEELNEIYPFASKKSKEETPEGEAFKAKAKSVTAELQKGDPVYTALWKEIIRISCADVKRNYDTLNVSFDYWYGESDAEKYVPELIDRLNEKGLLYESEGAMVVDVAEEGDKITVPPVIVKKSDNSNIYATTDLATLIQRMKDWKPDEVWYVVDSRQSLHFTQVFRCAKKAGIVPESVKLEHLGFGTMNGADGRPYKTRDGGVMRLETLYDMVYNYAKGMTKTNRVDGLQESWVCMGKIKHKKAFCPSLSIRGDRLRQAAAQAMGMEEFDDRAFLDQVDKIFTTEGEALEFHFYDGTVKEVPIMLFRADHVASRGANHPFPGYAWTQEHYEIVPEEAEMVRLAGMTGEDENTMQYPDNLVPRPAKVVTSDNGRRLAFDVAPFSINIIQTKLK